MYNQYQQTTKFNDLISRLNGILLVNPKDIYDNFFNLYTAMEGGLDNWGIILNQSRTIKTRNLLKNRFGVFKSSYYPNNFDGRQLTLPAGITYPQNFGKQTIQFNTVGTNTATLTNTYQTVYQAIYNALNATTTTPVYLNPVGNSDIIQFIQINTTAFQKTGTVDNTGTITINTTGTPQLNTRYYVLGGATPVPIDLNTRWGNFASTEAIVTLQDFQYRPLLVFLYLGYVLNRSVNACLISVNTYLSQIYGAGKYCEIEENTVLYGRNTFIYKFNFILNEIDFSLFRYNKILLRPAGINYEIQERTQSGKQIARY